MANNFITKDEFYDAVGLPTKDRSFITHKKLNQTAAAHRFSTTDRIFKEWFDEINSEKCNTRDMPADLILLYEDACEIMLEILAKEKEIVSGNRS